VLYFCVNRAPQSANSFTCHKSKESPSNSFSFHTSRTQGLNSFICLTSMKTTGRIPSQPTYSLEGSEPHLPIHTSHSFLSLVALEPKSVSHLFCIQSVPHSFSKMPGCMGAPHHKILKVLLELVSHFGTRLLPFPLAPQLVLSRPLCDNLGLPFQQELRLRCPVRAPRKQ
jgi:hypothetical protein